MAHKRKHYEVSEMEEEENVVRVRFRCAVPLLLATRSLQRARSHSRRFSRFWQLVHYPLPSACTFAFEVLLYGIHLTSLQSWLLPVRLVLNRILVPSMHVSLTSGYCTCGRPVEKLYRRAQVK